MRRVTTPIAAKSTPYRYHPLEFPNTPRAGDTKSGRQCRSWEARVERLIRQIADLVPGWSLGPVVEAVQAMRGVAFIVTVTVVAEVGDFTAASGSGRRRSRFGLGFGCAVGRTSPDCHAVRSAARKVSSDGGFFGSHAGHIGNVDQPLLRRPYVPQEADRVQRHEKRRAP